MGDVQVKGAAMAGSRIERLLVGIARLPDRTIGRDLAVQWMRDGHSLIPVVGGERGAALQLVELESGEHVIRTDNAPVDADELPPVPAL